MSMNLNLKDSDLNLYVPEKARVSKVEIFTPKERRLELELLSGKRLGHCAGQFVQVSILGIGEAPISIASPPSSTNKFDLCVRAVGEVTNKLHQLKEGDELYIRGPFGHGFDQKILDRMKSKHLLFIAGGIGYFPLRSLINQVLEAPAEYKKISILYGCKTPADRMFKNELDQISKKGGNIELLETVDHPDDQWKQHSGVITTLIPKVQFNPDETIAVIVGPPIMYKFVLIALREAKIPSKNIYMSLERRMKCGVGKCGHCQMEGIYVCQEGPVFNYADVQTNEEVF